jgi:hypothetical protein
LTSHLAGGTRRLMTARFADEIPEHAPISFLGVMI